MLVVQQMHMGKPSDAHGGKFPRRHCLLRSKLRSKPWSFRLLLSLHSNVAVGVSIAE